VLPRRLPALALAAAAAVVVLVLMLGGGSYQVSVTLANASQLVKGDEVKVGGVPVGSVSSIGLTADGRARLRLSISDDSLTPLHQGTRALIRSVSLAGIANRYVALTPGPNSAPKIPDGGRIAADDAQAEVDLDAVLNALGPTAQHDLTRLIRASSGIVGKRSEHLANEGLRDLNPALGQWAATMHEFTADEPAFERLVVESADVVSTVVSRPTDLDQLVGNASGALNALADRSAAIDRTLVKLPNTLRAANTTLVNVRGLIGDLRPALRDARPAAPLLSQLLRRLAPIARRARPLVARASSTAGGPLLDVVEGFVPLARAAEPAFKSAHDTLVDALPVVVDARPYAPDVVGGLVYGFGGSTSGYYDANGHYARISFQGGKNSLDNALSPVSLPSKGVTFRCPGAATQAAPDKSNPWCP
jgi:phospholipid/cholesterol/gamma-HCH transport system substrate-binding protein